MKWYKRIGNDLEHRLIAQRILKRCLKGQEQVHHVDYNKANNENKNLVICPDRYYHELIHRRTDALLACGNADYLRCTICNEYDAPENLRLFSPATTNRKVHHITCYNIWQKQKRLRRKNLVTQKLDTQQT